MVRSLKDASPWQHYAENACATLGDLIRMADLLALRAAERGSPYKDTFLCLARSARECSQGAGIGENSNDRSRGIPHSFIIIHNRDHWSFHQFLFLRCVSPSWANWQGKEKYPYDLGRSTLAARNAQKICHSYEIGQRVRMHFPHDVAAMHLHRDLAQTYFASDLFVEQVPAVTNPMTSFSRPVSVAESAFRLLRRFGSPFASLDHGRAPRRTELSRS